MCASAALCGYAGFITGAGGTEVVSWEVTQTVEAVDATSMSSAGWKERVACLRGASGNFKTIGTSSTVGLHGTCTFTDAIGGYSIAGDIIINKISPNTPVDGIVSFTHDFTFTGAVAAA